MLDEPKRNSTQDVAPFGTIFAPYMVVAKYAENNWAEPESMPLGPLPLHPGSHVFHYGSSCFEGMKAFLMPDGMVRIFRLDRHVARLQESAQTVCLPLPPRETIEGMIRKTVELCRDAIPNEPGALYLRPTLIGTESNIGAAGAASGEALFFVIASPVGDYFSSDGRSLRIKIEDQQMRAVPGFGSAKTGGNYASALRHVVKARETDQADQVLFCPDGDVQETGASNFLLINDHQILTKPVTDAFLHGVTRDSVLTLGESLGYEIVERDFTVAEIKEWIKTGEAALSGTAAVLSGVGSFIHNGMSFTVGDGKIGANTKRLGEALKAIQAGRARDSFHWLS